MKIRAINLSKRFNGKRVLEDINLEIEENRITCFLGPNGAGKTTLLRILDLLEEPTTGEIVFYNQAGLRLQVTGYRNRLELRRRMVMVMQNPIMFNDTVYANVSYGLRIHHKKNIEQKVDEILEMLGLDRLRNIPARNLSGGEKQRVALARGLVLEPELLFLDEPTSDLDPLSIRIIEDLLPQLKMTIVLATHNLLQAERFGQKIYLLNQGKIVQEGRPEQIFTQPYSSFVAEFIGLENIWQGEIIEENGNKFFCSGNLRIEIVTELEGKVHAALRPEEILLSNDALHSSARNCFLGKIIDLEQRGAIFLVKVDVNGLPFQAMVTKKSKEELDLQLYKSIYLAFKASAVHIFKERTT